MSSEYFWTWATARTAAWTASWGQAGQPPIRHHVNCNTPTAKLCQGQRRGPRSDHSLPSIHEPATFCRLRCAPSTARNILGNSQSAFVPLRLWRPEISLLLATCMYKYTLLLSFPHAMSTSDSWHTTTSGTMKLLFAPVFLPSWTTSRTVRCALFGHIARLYPESVPANHALRCHVDPSL